MAPHPAVQAVIDLSSGAIGKLHCFICHNILINLIKCTPATVFNLYEILTLILLLYQATR